MNAIITILVISGLIELVLSVCTTSQSLTVAQLNQQLLDGNAYNEYLSLSYNYFKKKSFLASKTGNTQLAISAIQLGANVNIKHAEDINNFPLFYGITTIIWYKT